MALRLEKALVGAVILALCGAPLARCEEGAKRIAIVNVKRVFDSFLKVKECEEALKKRFEDEDKKLETDWRMLRDREDALRTDPRDRNTDPTLLKDIQALELAKLEWTLRKKDRDQRLETEKKNEIKKLLNTIKQTIRDVSLAEKYDLVLRAPEFEEEFDINKAGALEKEKTEDSPTALDLVRKFRDNPVLFFDQKVDITNKIIEKLNDLSAFKPN
jgi:Skp family chaperone for outer membrane proteins